MQEFFSWKEKERSEKYFCQNDGHSKARRRKEEPDRETKKGYHHGRIKRDTFCSARMNVKLHESDSMVSVTYIRAHNQPIGIENTVHQKLQQVY